MDELKYVKYEVADSVGTITLARPDKANAQNERLLDELDDRFTAAEYDDDVKVIVVAADGPHFSSGHDLRDTSSMSDYEPVGAWGGFDLPGDEGYVAQEQEIYLGLCWRWRNLPKPTIAQVQGKVIAGGLMLVWPFDLIVASEDATFADPVVAFGVNGHEYFVHTWEVGARKAKEMLFTGAALSAEECRQLGMVNHVVPCEELEDFTLKLAQRIASRPGMGLKLAKQAVNQSLDAQGQWTALQSAFTLHQLGHSHALQVHGIRVDPTGMEVIRREAKSGA